MGDFKIGDKVEVVDIGESYEYYKKMFKELNLKKPNESNFNVLNEGIVFGISKHDITDDICVAIRDNDGDEMLINSKGLELIEENSIIDFDLMGYSVLVDNPEQARKLQEYAFKQGFVWMSGEKEVLYLGCKSFQFGIFGSKKITKTEGRDHYQDEGITKKAHFNDIFGETKALKKEDVYVVLKGKTEEELRDLYAFLIENNEPLLCDFRINKSNEVLEFYDSKWTGSRFDEEKTRVTIEQLKQIIRPMETETLKEKVERLEKELEQTKKELEDSKPKVGDIGLFWDDNKEESVIGKLCEVGGSFYEYISNEVCCYKNFEPLPTELQEQLRPYLETNTFVLPEKWCIKDCEEVSEWASFEFDCAKFVNEGFYLVVSREFKDGYVFKKEKPTNCTEITLEQFKKYVLNK